jgi:arylsulfatase A-like enzyme
LILLIYAGASSCARHEPERPNLIVVLTDDHGYADLGSQGAVQDVKTPHLDALAAEGVRFTRAYVTAPQCVPSRAGLLTGRQQTRFGMDRNRSGPLPDSERTLADRLRAAGYRTGMIGKWHLDGGLGKDHAPAERGFDEYFEGSLDVYQANFDLAGGDLTGAPQTLRDPRYRIDVQTDAAIAFLERRRSEPRQPYFLYLAYSAPHVPLDCPGRYVTRFRDVADKTRRAGLGSIAAIDDGVGRIRQFLREHAMEENTLLFVLSDNGAPIRREKWNGSRNDPLIGEKGMLTDGGIRVPFLAVWKSVLPGGKVEPRAVSTLDVAATALALADQDPVPELDGVNLLPFLTGENAAAPHEFLFWRWRSQAAIFDGHWKLIFLPPDRWLLFDHSADAPENDDVASRHPEVVARLRSRLEAWAAEQEPPRLPRELDRRDLRLYDTHLKLSVAGATR